MRPYFFFVILVFKCLVVFGQIRPERDKLTVLRFNNVGKTYVFDRSAGNNYDRTELTYLGRITTEKGRVLKILILRWYWGLSPRATNRILVFNRKNQYMGSYLVTLTTDLPDRIEKNALVFENKTRESCDPVIVNRISLYKGLPKCFFLGCKDKMGDVYCFGSN